MKKNFLSSSIVKVKSSGNAIPGQLNTLQKETASSDEIESPSSAALSSLQSVLGGLGFILNRVQFSS